MLLLATAISVLLAVTSANNNTFKVTSEAVLDIEVKNYDGEGNDLNGEIRVALFGEEAPATVLNYKALCAGFKRPQTKEKIGYSNTYCHKVVKDMILQCGDVFNQQGVGGTSVFGETFNDESFEVSHTSGGVISMANKGKNTNQSQFFFTMGPARFFDNKHVAFGKVTKGFQYLAAINRVGTQEGHHFPARPVKIADCSITENFKEYTMTTKQMSTTDLEGIVTMS